MKKTLALLAMVLLANAAGASQALATRYACVACHQADKKQIGPSWRDVAARYADGSKTLVQLAQSIKAGGAGTWGSLPMPSQPALASADAEALAQWILGQGPAKP